MNMRIMNSTVDLDVEDSHRSVIDENQWTTDTGFGYYGKGLCGTIINFCKIDNRIWCSSYLKMNHISVLNNPGEVDMQFNNFKQK